MKETLPENAILGRSGGDEFCAFLPNSNCKEAKSCIATFAKMKRTFLYEGKERNFSIHWDMQNIRYMQIIIQT